MQDFEVQRRFEDAVAVLKVFLYFIPWRCTTRKIVCLCSDFLPSVSPQFRCWLLWLSRITISVGCICGVRLLCMCVFPNIFILCGVWWSPAFNLSRWPVGRGRKSGCACVLRERSQSTVLVPRFLSIASCNCHNGLLCATRRIVGRIEGYERTDSLVVTGTLPGFTQGCRSAAFTRSLHKEQTYK